MARSRSTRRTVALGLIVWAAAWVGPVLASAPAAASGGGGCGGPITDWSESEVSGPLTVARSGPGPEVEISRFCFTPTVLRVAIREEVRFTNLDPVQHNVLGANSQWGSFQFLKPYRGKSPADWDTYRFMQAGVFPYVCTMHPGMVGTVVVGQTAGSVATSTMSPAVPIAARPARLVSESRPVAATDGWKAMAVAVPLVVVLLGLVLVEQRRDRWPEP